MGQRINSHNIILTGDFNIPNIDWSKNSITSAPFSSARKLLELLEKHGIQQMVREPTSRQRHAQNILDFVLTNNESIIQSLVVVHGTRGHDMAVFNINLKPKKKKLPKRKIFIRKEANIDRMKDDMMSFCDFFMSNLTESSVNHNWNELEKALKSTMERNISIKTSSSRFNRPRFNRTQGRLCRKKQRLYNAAKMTQTWPNIDQ